MKKSLYNIQGEFETIMYAIMDNDGEMDETLEQLLQENEEEFFQKLDGYGEVIAKLKDKAAAAAGRIKDIQAIKKRAEKGVERMKDYIKHCMEQRGITKCESGLNTFSIRTNNGFEYDEQKLTGDAWEKIYALGLPAWIKFDVSIDKTKLKEMYKEGNVVEGVSPTQTDSLQIR